MKYGSTSRVLCLLFHGLIALGGAILAVYFGFFVLTTRFFDPDMFITTALPVNLILELAVYGTTGAVISGVGFYHAVKAVVNPSDDAPVLKSFRDFIVLGYVSALFFLLNGAVFFDLTANSMGSDSNPAFVIVVAIIIAVGLLIASNVPMVRLFDTKGSTEMYKELAYGFALNFLAVTFYSLIAILSVFLGTYNTTDYTYIILWIYIGLSLVAGVMMLLCGVFTGKRNALSGLFGCLSVVVIGAAFATIGGLEIGWGNGGAFHFNSWVAQMNISSTTNSYGIACIVFGAVAAVAGIGSLLIVFKPWETPEAKE